MQKITKYKDILQEEISSRHLNCLISGSVSVVGRKKVL